MSRRLFGTDGVRGVANIHPMTAETALQLGRAAAYLFKHHDRRSRIVIGKDTRLSGYMLESALVAGICSMGVDALLVGPLPTPGIAFLTASMRADAGVVISASHNPYQDNGIKFFARDGFKLPDEVEAKLEELVFTPTSIDALRPTAAEVGKAFRIDDAVGRYVVFLKNSFPKEFDLVGLKIVLDCAHGAAYKVAPEVFTELGAEVIAYGDKPNGTNINAGCGSMHPEVIAAAVREHGAHLGIALDGDADRCIFVDEHGSEVDGDHILAICGTHMLAQGKLPQRTVVATVMSNIGLDIALKRAGGCVVKTAVGDRYVVEEMRRHDYRLGGEQSGHMIFLDHNTTGDGVITALQVLAIMQQTGKPLSELAGVMTALPQVLVNVRVRERRPIEQVPEIARKVQGVTAHLGDDGRVLIRYSGTEPLLRIMLEGQNQEEITELANDLAETVKTHLGAGAGGSHG
ncbi:MAG: phosphoglucosamine mutase [Desulfuromonadales bacterium]|nr:phosphoglucosamine mutase [Desulfuromonadales bacterium]